MGKQWIKICKIAKILKWVSFYRTIKCWLLVEIWDVGIFLFYSQRNKNTSQGEAHSSEQIIKSQVLMKCVFVWIIKWNIAYWIFKVMRRQMMFQRRLHWLTRRKYGLYSSTSPSWQNSAITKSGRSYNDGLWDRPSQQHPKGHLPSLAEVKMLTKSFQ